jgi:glutathione S-transferase
MRARMALQVAGTDYEHREILLRDKPAHMLEISPKGSVPVFAIDGEVIDESLDIMKWAMPRATFQSDIIKMIDGPFKHHLDRYKYASRYDRGVERGDVDLSHRVKAVDALKLIEDRLGEESYLEGEEMGPTDMASFPFVRQFAAVEPEWWASNDDLSKTRNWLAHCLESELFKSIMEKHPLWIAGT